MKRKLKYKPLSHLEISHLCYQYSLAFSSDIPFMDSVEFIHEEQSSASLKGYTKKILDEIKKGSSFAKAMDTLDWLPQSLKDTLFIAEKTGKLPETLKDLSDHYAQTYETKESIKSAVTYPLILLAMMAGVLLLLIIKVLPIFHDILLSMGGDIPKITDYLLSGSQYLFERRYSLLLGLLVLSLFFVFWAKHPRMMKRRQKLAFHMPLIAPLMRKYLSVQLSRNLAMMIESGMNHDDALQSAIGALHFSELHYNKEVKNIHEQLKTLNLFSKTHLKMVHLAERTGKLEETLIHIATENQMTLQRELKKSIQLLEPSLVLILSLIIGAILMVVMFPLIELMSSMGA